MAGLRLDQAAARLMTGFSRERLKEWIEEGSLLCNGRVGRPKDRVHAGDELVLDAEMEVEVEAVAENIPLEILYEDTEILVINKPAGLVVHPGAGNPTGTLLNALLYHSPDLERLPRAGIVHRLDKDTSGLLVVAKTLSAQSSLVSQLQSKTVYREYEAVVNGVLVSGATVEAPISRHPADRLRMAVVASGKPAVTHYRVLERFRGHSHLRVILETGRTHQIRVHMTHVGHPLVGDPTYGGRPRPPRGASEALLRSLSDFSRQALHARRLSLCHPASGQEMSWSVELPEDMLQLLAVLREDAESLNFGNSY